MQGILEVNHKILEDLGAENEMSEVGGAEEESVGMRDDRVGEVWDSVLCKLEW